MSCPNCPCASCVEERASEAYWRRSYNQQVGVSEPECAFERFAREYAARGEPMPTVWHYSCNCRKCSPICGAV